jgi:protein SCO1/2
MNRFNRLKKILILVLILAVPGFLYYLLTAEGKNRYKPLPFFGPKHLSGTYHTVHGKKIPDTIFHQVGDFNLTDQQGKQVSFKTIGKKILVLNFFYTHAPDASLQLNSSMDSLVKYFGTNKLLAFASITVDPKRDSVWLLRQYATRFAQPADKWLFLTGDTAVIYPLAHKGLLVDALQTGRYDFVFSNKIILLDTEHRIRGYYDGTNPDEITRLADELKLQITEELRKNDKPLY